MVPASRRCTTQRRPPPLWSVRTVSAVPADACRVGADGIPAGLSIASTPWASNSTGSAPGSTDGPAPMRSRSPVRTVREATLQRCPLRKTAPAAIRPRAAVRETDAAAATARSRRSAGPPWSRPPAGSWHMACRARPIPGPPGPAGAVVAVPARDHTP
jgi:hypothetical protein